MAMSARERIDTLENALKELAYAGRRTEMSLDRLSQETGEFKGEMRAFKEENRRESRRMNLQWGALANKMGSFVEDMVLPSFPHILERYFGVTEVDDLLVRRRKPHPSDHSRRKEFDLIAWTADTVFVNETKSTPTIESFTEFVRDRESVFEYFPELSGRTLVKIASALTMPRELITYLTAHGCYAMMLGDETMDLVNVSDVSSDGGNAQS
ncbi:MAG TPA: hypothetical protein VMV68_02045 [Spirochaetia bacterium]|nr:hypothetical protein [Spirochaetia bacterium]